MRGFFGRGVYNGVETQPGGGEDVQEQEMIAQLLQQDERGMEALLLHYGPLMRYIIAPILPDPQDREECLSEVSMRVGSRIAQFDPARGSWNAWLTAGTRSTAPGVRPATDIALPDLSNRPSGMIVFLPASKE